MTDEDLEHYAACAEEEGLDRDRAMRIVAYAIRLRTRDARLLKIMHAFRTGPAGPADVAELTALFEAWDAALAETRVRP